jgi:hypothetical protein
MNKTVYIVQEFGWDYNDEWYEPYIFDESKMENDDPLVSRSFATNVFKTLEEAEAYRRPLEQQARKNWDTSSLEWHRIPFAFENTQTKWPHGWTSLSSLPWDTFIEQARAIGSSFDLKTKMETNSTWYEGFWDAVETTNTFPEGFWEAVRILPDEQYHAFYDLFDLLNFYRVVELQLDAKTLAMDFEE